MHLRLEDSELIVLLDMVSLASSVANWSDKTSETPHFQAYRAVEQKILKRVHESGFADIVQWNASDELYQLREAYIENSFHWQCIEEFRDSAFWEDLMIRLAERDLIPKIGEVRWSQLSDDERRKLARNQEEHYWEEFSKRGIAQLFLIHPEYEG